MGNERSSQKKSYYKFIKVDEFNRGETNTNEWSNELKRIRVSDGW